MGSSPPGPEAGSRAARGSRGRPRGPREAARAPLAGRLAGAVSRASFLFLLVVVGGLMLGGAAASLRWRVLHDTPILLYLGWLIEAHHRVPYRDFFDMNLPGTYAFFALASRWLGRGDPGYRVLDLSVLAGILAAGGFALRPFGARVSLIGGALFALQYLSLGPTHSLQREYLMLLPLALALLALSPGTALAPGARAAWSGLLFGLAATIKPAFLIGFPAVLLYLAALERPAGADAGGGRGRPVWIALAAMLAPLALTAAALAARGALVPFLDMARHYWPLYARIGPLHQVVADRERLADLVGGVWAMGGRRWWLVPAALGAAHAAVSVGWRDPRGRFVALLAALAVGFALYPAAAGQFWPYHWLPFACVTAWLSALGLSSLPRAGGGLLRAAAPLALVAVFLFKGLPPDPLYDPLRGKSVAPPAGGRVEKMAAYLRAHLRAGDTVQPLDWTGGAVHAMWLAHADLATSFVYDFHFYHHVSTPYIQALRRRFVQELAAAPPRVIIWVETDKPWVGGEDTTHKFPALEEFLADHYRIDALGDGYVMLLRRD